MITNELSIRSHGEALQLTDSPAVAGETATRAEETENTQASGLPVAFTVKRAAGFAKSEPWRVTLEKDSARFSPVEGGEPIEIPQEKALGQMAFTKEFSMLASKTLNVTHAGEVYTFQLDSGARSQVLSWLPKHTAAELKRELQAWGGGLIFLGVVHVLLHGILDPVWGAVICAVGVLNLLIPHKAMFALNGVCLILVGLLNAAAGGGWKVFGMLQLIWGIQEMRKMGRYE